MTLIGIKTYRETETKTEKVAEEGVKSGLNVLDR